MNRVVTMGLSQPWLVALLTAILIAAGVWSLQRLPVDAYPDVSPPGVEMTAQWPGHAAEEVERLITVPIETELNGLPNLVVTRSVSLYGLSNVRVTFTDGTDLYFARQQVLERLRGVSLPEGVDTDVEPPFSPSGLVYRYVLQSPDRSAMIRNEGFKTRSPFACVSMAAFSINGTNRSVSKFEILSCSTAAMRSSPAPVSIDGLGSSVSSPFALRSNCMKTRFHIST